jgi:hypothetical protein
VVREYSKEMALEPKGQREGGAIAQKSVSSEKATHVEVLGQERTSHAPKTEAEEDKNGISGRRQGWSHGEEVACGVAIVVSY